MEKYLIILVLVLASLACEAQAVTPKLAGGVRPSSEAHSVMDVLPEPSNKSITEICLEGTTCP